MSKRSRTKGHAWERALARMFREAGWPDAGRTLHETRDGNCGDLEFVKPLSLQAKCGGNPSVWRAIKEAEEAASPGDFPVAAVKRDRRRPIVVLYLDDFMEIASQLKSTGTW